MNNLEKLKFKKEGLILYKAGTPQFKNNFTRDSILSGILMQNSGMLKDQLIFCSKKQGIKKNPFTGEEPGKIFHEYPGKKIRGLSTKFSASDTTALFLIGHEIYQRLTKDKILAIQQKNSIIKAVNYIKSHLKNNAFVEDPKFCRGNKFALKVTYWKDSVLPLRNRGEPVYPVVYTLSHIQNMRALRSASFLLNDNSLERISLKMLDYFNENLIDKKTNLPYIAIDKKGYLNYINSDLLHMLFYLKKGDISKKTLKAIVKNSKILETKAGYRTLEESYAKLVSNKYHAETIWPFEQAIIHAGAKKFNLKNVEKISLRILKYIKDKNPETLKIKNKKIIFSGCKSQLWTIAAKKYFKNKKGIFP